MAENEYLDSTKARRWQSVADGLVNGVELDELAERVQSCFYKTLRKAGQEIPLDDLIASVDDRSNLSRLCDDTEGASDVKSLLLIAAQDNDNKEAALQQFLRSALENCLYDIPLIAAERGGDVSLSDARRRLGEVQTRLAPDLRRMAEKWSENPSWKPQRQRTIAGTVKAPVDVTRNMLGESLIAGFRQ